MNYKPFKPNTNLVWAFKRCINYRGNSTRVALAFVGVQLEIWASSSSQPFFLDTRVDIGVWASALTAQSLMKALPLVR